MALVPPDSPLRLVPKNLDRKAVLFFDGIRYSFHMFEVSYERLIESLRSLSSDTVDRDQLATGIAAAIGDAWSLVDVVHRLRELLSQVPGLKKKSPELQHFLRETKGIESLRHFVQHLRNEIDRFASAAAPLWGSLAWVYTDPTTGQNSTFMVAPGTLFDGAAVPSCTVDTQLGRYVERIAFFAGPAKVDVAELADQVARFCAWYTDWFQSRYSDGPHHSADIHGHFKVMAVPRAR